MIFCFLNQKTHFVIDETLIAFREDFGQWTFRHWALIADSSECLVSRLFLFLLENSKSISSNRRVTTISEKTNWAWHFDISSNKIIWRCHCLLNWSLEFRMFMSQLFLIYSSSMLTFNGKPIFIKSYLIDLFSFCVSSGQNITWMNRWWKASWNRSLSSLWCYRSLQLFIGLIF